MVFNFLFYRCHLDVVRFAAAYVIVVEFVLLRKQLVYT